MKTVVFSDPIPRSISVRQGFSNDRGQELVLDMRCLLRDSPSLPSRHAFLLAWASELPVLVQMNALPEHHRSKSDDPDFWGVWSGEDCGGQTVERPVNWKTIADDWQQINAPDQK